MSIAFPNILNTDYTVAQATGSSTNTTITGNTPTGVAVGDLLEFALKMNNSANPLTVTPPSGLTLVASNTNGNGALRCFTEIYHLPITDAAVLASLPSSWVFTMSTGNVGDDSLVIRRITGVNLSDPVGAVSAFTNSTTVTPISPSITTTGNNSVVMYHVATKGANTFQVDGTGNPVGTTLIQNTRSRTVSSGVCYGAAYQAISTPQNIGTRSWGVYDDSDPPLLVTSYLSAAAYWSALSYELNAAQESASITDINDGDPVTYGQSVTWAATGFAPNTAVVDGVSATSVSSSGMTLPTLMDGELTPRPGTRTVSASEGDTSASSTISIEVPVGFQYVQLTTQVTDETRATPDEAESGDHFMVETTDSTVAYPNGTVGTNRVGSVVAWLIKDTTKLAGQYEIIFGEGGVVLEVKRLSAFKFSAFKPSAIKPKAEKL